VASFNYPQAVAIDGQGNVYIADAGNNRIRKVDALTGIISTVAGNGSNGYSGDGGPAIAASFYYPQGVAVDGQDSIYIVDAGNNRIRRVDALTGIITTVAGNGAADYSGDGGPAIEASINPAEVGVDGQGNIFIADFGNNRIRKVDALMGIITTVAGNGIKGYSGDGDPATEASLNGPQAVAVDGQGNVFITDAGNNRVRMVVAVK
jgi:streptogramin lyase